MKKVIPEDSVLVPDLAERVFKGKIFDVYQWQQTMFDGSSHTFEMLKRTDTVNAICVVDGKILVIDDEQPHLGTRRSFPGGRVDKTDENTLVAIQREIQEETGYSFKNWRLVRVWQPYRKIEWFVHVFLAWDVTGQQEPKLDPGEKITPIQLDFEEVKQEVIKGVGYLGDNIPLFEAVGGLEELLELPEFQGQAVDR